MGSSSSSVDHVVPDVLQLSRETGFSAAHLLRLHERFEVLDRGQTGELRPQDFAALQGLALNPIGDRIIGAFFSAGQEAVDFPSFVRVLAHFLPVDSNRGGTQAEPANSRTGKLRFAFQMYDQDGDGKISREELLQVTEEQLQSIGERAIRETDLDGDDAIGFDEFRKVRRIDVCGENEHRSHDEYSLPEVTTGPGEEEFMNMFYVSTTIKESFTRCCRARVEPPGGTITESISRQDRERSPSRLNSDANGKQFLQLSSAVVMETPLFVLLCGRSVPPDEGR
ncbi:hypothetical protein F2P81_017669 [Scophthalmus maximus]|uniref:EF-hand domain-containing protein n=1 Tax=Scophthalmus maximus TaxID=52904 RepID=A0A6A4SFD6_SCOMX|nr:hypothetical protein F2P81_017669 [Scophthalmus maximus]